MALSSMHNKVTGPKRGKSGREWQRRNLIGITCEMKMAVGGGYWLSCAVTPPMPIRIVRGGGPHDGEDQAWLGGGSMKRGLTSKA